MSGDVVTSYTVYGRMTAPAFQQCVEAAAYVNQAFPESYAVSVTQELPRDYEGRRARWLAAGQLAVEKQHATVLVHNATADTLATAEDFIHDVSRKTRYTADLSAMDAAHPDSYAKRAQHAWLGFLDSRDRQYCWLDVQIGAAPVGRIWLELFSSLTPLTCKNFCELCRGTHVTVEEQGGEPRRLQLAYKGTTFFRTLKDAWVMAGDVAGDHTGNGGFSCYGRCFPDETFAVSHDAAGMLGMCNDGPHTNASSFYITRRPMSCMDGKYVAFGRVMDGMEVVDAIHATEVKHNHAPVTRIAIVDCGVLDPSG